MLNVIELNSLLIWNNGIIRMLINDNWGLFYIFFFVCELLEIFRLIYYLCRY